MKSRRFADDPTSIGYESGRKRYENVVNNVVSSNGGVFRDFICCRMYIFPMYFCYLVLFIFIFFFLIDVSNRLLFEITYGAVDDM